MTQEVDLGKIEKRAWITFSSKDGLFDLLIGVLLLINGIQGFVYNFWFTMFILIAVLIVPIGKKYITIPRVGKVKFGPSRQVKQLKLMIIIGVAVASTFIIYLLQVIMENPPEYLGSLFIATMVAVIFGAMAYYMNHFRLFIYGLMFAAGELIRGIFGKPAGPLAMLIFGIIIIFIALVVLARFLRKYPLPNNEVANGL